LVLDRLWDGWPTYPQRLIRSSFPSAQRSDSARSRPKNALIRSRTPVVAGRSWTIFPPDRNVRWTSGWASATRATGLGAVGLQERPPDRGVEEEVADLHHRADGAAATPDRAGDPGLDLDLRALVGVGASGLAADLGNLGDRRQGLAPEAERADVMQVIGLDELARRVGLERQEQVVGEHPLAVVGHPDQVLPAALDGDLDPPGLRVDRILHQLLHDRRRPLDHLARGDLVHDRRRQLPDHSHAGDLRSAAPALLSSIFYLLI
jgi:hypothetical protein